MDKQALPRSTTELLERIDRSWTALQQAVDSLSDAHLNRLEGDDDWSVKDHLAHISAWEGKLLAVVQGRPAHEGLGMDEATYQKSDTDGINRLIYERNKDRSLEDVLADCQKTHRRLVDALKQLDDAALSRPYVPDDPDDPRPLVQGIANNTYAHYDEHRAWIEGLIGRMGGQE